MTSVIPLYIVGPRLVMSYLTLFVHLNFKLDENISVRLQMRSRFLRITFSYLSFRIHMVPLYSTDRSYEDRERGKERKCGSRAVCNLTPYSSLICESGIQPSVCFFFLTLSWI